MAKSILEQFNNGKISMEDAKEVFVKRFRFLDAHLELVESQVITEEQAALAYQAFRDNEISIEQARDEFEQRKIARKTATSTPELKSHGSNIKSPPWQKPNEWKEPTGQPIPGGWRGRLVGYVLNLYNGGNSGSFEKTAWSASSYSSRSTLQLFDNGRFCRRSTSRVSLDTYNPYNADPYLAQISSSSASETVIDGTWFINEEKAVLTLTADESSNSTEHALRLHDDGTIGIGFNKYYT